MKNIYIGGGFYIHSGFVKRLIRTCKVLGVYKGLVEFTCGHLGMYLHSSRMCEVKHKIIEGHLMKRCPLESEETSRICEEVIANKKLESKERIWFYWAQGTESMPEVVRMCYNYLVYNNSRDNREIVLLTQKNVEDYIKFPQYITQTLSEGRMTLTQYSEILRMALLYEYGGMWLDSTVFVPKPIDKECFDIKYWSHKSTDYNWFNVVRGRWSLSIWNADKPHEELFKKMTSSMLLYWKKEKYLIDYMWMDYFLDIIYSNCSEIKRDIDSVPLNNPLTNSFFDYAKKEYIESEYRKKLESTNFYKFSYKHHYPKTIKGKETVYGYIIRNMPQLS